MKVGPHVMTHSHRSEQHQDKEVIPRVGSAQAGGNLKLIQCQLMLLLHARRCQQRHEIILAQHNGLPQPTVTNNMAKALLLNCPVRHCRAMKEVLNHMKTCRTENFDCRFQHCTTSLRILSHWTNCTVEECPLCQCVRQRMRRAKEWEQTLPRSSRYTLLAAALRSTQAPRPVAPNCNAAEQAQEGQSGVPCQGQDELRVVVPVNGDNPEQQPLQLQQPTAQAQPQPQMQLQAKETGNVNVAAAQPTASTPSLDQVRQAYEQLGIPCPEAALKRLMATLPSSTLACRKRARFQRQKCASSSKAALAFLADSDSNSMDTSDQGVYDCTSSEQSPASSSIDSDTEKSNEVMQPSSSSTRADPPVTLRAPRIPPISSIFLPSRPS